MGLIDSFFNFFKDYWYVFVGLMAIFLFWFYTKKVDITTKNSLKKVFSKKILIVISFIGVWYIWYKTGGSIDIAQANWWMPFIGLIILACANFVGVLRYQSQQIICANGFHGSYCDPPTCINGFLIFAIDSFNAGGLSWKYAGRILILREETTEFCDTGAISIAKPDYSYDYELDPDVKNFINNDAHFKGKGKKMFYGWFDDISRIDYDLEQLNKLNKLEGEDKEIYDLLKVEFGVKNPKISKLYWLYKNECKASNKQTEQYDATIVGIDKFADHTRRIKDTYNIKDEQTTKPEGHEEY